MLSARLLSISLMFACGTAFARDIFVDNVVGDDRRGGTSVAVSGESGPCRSINKALRIARSSDRIVVANTGQPYRETLSLQGVNHSGTDRYPFILSGNGATLDGTTTLDGATWEYAGRGAFRTRPPALSFQQLFLDDQPAIRERPIDDQLPKLAPKSWALLRGWLYFGVDEGTLPYAYNLSCCGQQTAITLYDVHDVVVEDLNIRGYWLDGVNCHDNVRRTDLVRLNSRENGRGGISIGGSSRVRIDTCTVGGNGAAQIRAEGPCVVQLIDNAIDASTAPALVREGGKIIESND